MLLCNDEVLRANVDELEFGSRLAAAARTSVKRNSIMLIIVSQLQSSISVTTSAQGERIRLSFWKLLETRFIS